jgi:cysteine desulfurase/selenocysteine lyase
MSGPIAESSAVPPAEPDWSALRAEFPILAHCAYMDIGRKAPLPRVARRATDRWFQDVDDTGGMHAFSMDGQEATRAAVARTFGAASDQIALIKNTSEGINIVAQGFPWEAGDNVIITRHEHENNTFPWRHLQRRGVNVKFAEADPDGCVRPEAYARVIDARTRMIAVAYVAYGNGYRADLDALSALARQSGAWLVVDAIQGVGVLARRLDRMGAEVVVAGGHKAQFSLAGAGLMYTTPEATQRLTPPYAAKFSFTSNDRHQAAPQLRHTARRFEYGNPNFLGLAVQRASAEWIAAIGLDNIEARVRAVTTYLIEQAEARQIKVRSPRNWHERAGIVALDVAGDADQVEAALRDKGVRVAAKDGYIRAAIHFYNDEGDVDRLVDGLARLRPSSA